MVCQTFILCMLKNKIKKQNNFTQFPKDKKWFISIIIHIIHFPLGAINLLSFWVLPGNIIQSPSSSSHSNTFFLPDSFTKPLSSSFFLGIIGFDWCWCSNSRNLSPRYASSINKLKSIASQNLYLILPLIPTLLIS